MPKRGKKNEPSKNGKEVTCGAGVGSVNKSPLRKKRRYSKALKDSATAEASSSSPTLVQSKQDDQGTNLPARTTTGRFKALKDSATAGASSSSPTLVQSKRDDKGTNLPARTTTGRFKALKDSVESATAEASSLSPTRVGSKRKNHGGYSLERITTGHTKDSSCEQSMSQAPVISQKIILQSSLSQNIDMQPELGQNSPSETGGGQTSEEVIFSTSEFSDMGDLICADSGPNQSKTSHGPNESGKDFQNDSVSEKEGTLDEYEEEIMDESEKENSNVGHQKKRNKIHCRQPISRNRMERKLARNRGDSYKTASGKEIPVKEAEALGDCRMKCSEKVTPGECSELCHGLWRQLADHDKRAAYICSLVEVTPKKTQKIYCDPPDGKTKRRRLTNFQYHIVVNGRNIPVCKACFMKIFQVSSKFIEIICAKKLTNKPGIIGKDLRGTVGNSVPDDKLQEVRDHLNSFPKYKSHYGRNKCDKAFLPNTLTIKKMYDLYREKTADPVSRWLYEREFHLMELRIKPLKIDTCKTCDYFHNAIMHSTSAAQTKEKEEQQQLHHHLWQKAVDVKKMDKENALRDKTLNVVAFDLQQCLPTPLLSTSVVFYLRQLWVYNLTIHDTGSGNSVHNMWHEGEALRGANEIGSALYWYILSLPDSVEEITLWSDTCGGQNKNGIINSALLVALSHKSTLKVINQKFLVSGHTHLECDTDHAVIEEKKKKAEFIHIPRDWYNLVSNASKKFTVKHLGQDQQLNFKALTKGRDSPLVKRKKDTDGQKFLWKEVVWLQHRRNLPCGVIAFKKSFEDDAPFHTLDMKRKKNADISHLNPDLTYSAPCHISEKKKEDLLSMLYLIDPECHRFYKKLASDGQIEDEDPDLIPSDFEIGSESESED